jgi:uncharacterized protein
MPQTGANMGRKHGLSLAQGKAVLEDPNRYFWADDRFDYGEERIITLGMSKQKILVVVSTEIIKAAEDEKIIRIISVRKAVKLEIDWYYLGRS